MRAVENKYRRARSVDEATNLGATRKDLEWDVKNYFPQLKGLKRPARSDRPNGHALANKL